MKKYYKSTEQIHAVFYPKSVAVIGTNKVKGTVPFDIFDWFARILPGDVITVGIDAMVNIIDTLNLGSTSETAKLIEQLMAALI